MDVLFSSVVRLSEQELSLKEISKRLHISEQKVRKILITAGMWSSETSRKISSLVESGKSLDEIQAALSAAAEPHPTGNWLCRLSGCS